MKNCQKLFSFKMKKVQLFLWARIMFTFIFVSINFLSFFAFKISASTLPEEEVPEISFGYNRESILTAQKRLLEKLEKEAEEFKMTKDELSTTLKNNHNAILKLLETIKEKIDKASSADVLSKYEEANAKAKKLEAQILEELELLETRQLVYKQAIDQAKEFVSLLEKDQIGSIAAKDIFHLEDLENAQLEISNWENKLLEVKRRTSNLKRDLKTLHDEVISLKATFPEKLKKINTQIKNLTQEKLPSAFVDDKSILEAEMMMLEMEKDLLKAGLAIAEQKLLKTQIEEQMLKAEMEKYNYLIKMGKDKLVDIRKKIVITPQEVENAKEIAKKEKEKSKEELEELSQKRKEARDRYDEAQENLANAKKELEKADKDLQKILYQKQIELYTTQSELAKEELDYYDRLEDFLIQKTHFYELKAELVELKAHLFSRQLTSFAIQSNLTKIKNTINEMNMIKQSLYEERTRYYEKLEIRRKEIILAREELRKADQTIPRSFFSTTPKKIEKTMEDIIETLEKRENLLNNFIELNKRYASFCDETLFALNNFQNDLEAEGKEKKLFGRSAWAISFEVLEFIFKDVNDFLFKIQHPIGTLIYTYSPRKGFPVHLREIILSLLTIILTLFLRVYILRLLNFLKTRFENNLSQLNQLLRDKPELKTVKRKARWTELILYLIALFRKAHSYVLLLLSLYIILTVFEADPYILKGIIWFLIGLLIARLLAFTLSYVKNIKYWYGFLNSPRKMRNIFVFQLG